MNTKESKQYLDLIISTSFGNSMAKALADGRAVPFQCHEELLCSDCPIRRAGRSYCWIEDKRNYAQWQEAYRNWLASRLNMEVDQ